LNILIEDIVNGIVICIECGQINGTLFDRTAEWHDHDEGKMENGRCGAPVNKLLPLSSLGTNMKGNSRIKMIHNWSVVVYKERTLIGVFKIIREICDMMKLKKHVEDDANIIYKYVYECESVSGLRQIIRGVNKEALIAACVVFACKRQNIIIELKKLAECKNLKYTQLTKGFKILAKLLKTRNAQTNNTLFNYNVDASALLAEQYVDQFGKRMRLEQRDIAKAQSILINVQKIDLISDNTPMAIAAGCMMLMSTINNLKYLTRKIIANEFKISETTVQKTFKKLDTYKSLIMNPVKVEQIVKESEKRRENIPSHIIKKCKRFKITL